MTDKRRGFSITINDGFCAWEYGITLGDNHSISEVIEGVCKALETEITEAKMVWVKGEETIPVYPDMKLVGVKFENQVHEETGFLEWIREEGYVLYKDGKWYKRGEYRPWNKVVYYTSEELVNLFKGQK